MRYRHLAVLNNPSGVPKVLRLGLREGVMFTLMFISLLVGWHPYAVWFIVPSILELTIGLGDSFKEEK